ncbi:hypothetical protein GCM10011428_32050 [Streptomyces violaceus]
MRAHTAIPLALFTVLAVTIGWGLLRDPYTVNTTARLAAPSWPTRSAPTVSDVTCSPGWATAPPPRSVRRRPSAC